MKRLITFIFGTRPEIIKLSPLIKLCIRKNVPFKMIHSGQHYSYNMDRVFFKELQLPKPDYLLNIRSKSPQMQGEHTGRMLIDIEKILLKDKPYCVVVHGDTNTALAGALTAEKISTTKSYTGLEIKVAHVEAGLRSYDRSMPEEVNRFIIDHLSDFLFAPTAFEKKILIKEDVPSKRVSVVGNSIVDAVYANSKLAKGKNALKKLSLSNKKYILLTIHRQENVDSKKRLRGIFKGIGLVSKELSMPVLFPIHPRTLKKMKEFNIPLPAWARILEPTDFLMFLNLETNASLIMTDSGGLQEEACILRVPCVTIRENTERPETVEVGANIIGGVDSRSILLSAKKMINKRRKWRNPLGDGKTSEKIFKVLFKR